MATTKKSNYTPINATSAAGIDYSKYLDEVAKQQAYLAANPTAGQAMSQQEKQEKYGSITDPIWNTGVYTKDKDGAYAAGAQWGVEVTPTTYFNGDDGYYYVPDVKDQRTVQQGASGADEGLMNNQDYAIVQSLKQDFANAQSGYNTAVAAGNAELAAQYQQAMDNAHLEAERIRAGYGYSGGQDGSMYITHGKLGVGESSGGGGYTGGSYGSVGSVSGGFGDSYASGLTVPTVGNLSANVEDYSAYLEQMYAAQKAAALAQLNAAYEKNVNELDRAEVGVGEQYQAARNLSAGQSEQLKRNFAQYAAANGLNNGTAGQAELSRSVALQNNLNGINTAEADTLAEVQLARANAEVEYNNAIAQAESTGDYELAAALYQEKVRVQEALIELEIRQHQFALKQYQLQYQAQQDAIANQLTADKFTFQQRKYAESLAQSQLEYANALAQEQKANLAGYGEAYLALGILPSAEMLAAMGLSETDARKYIAAIQAEKK